MTEKEFKEYVLGWAEKIGVKDKISSIQLRDLKTKLASCSSKGRLTFDKSILHNDTETVQEIVIHELLHLRYQNHGKLFKLMLKTYLKESS